MAQLCDDCQQNKDKTGLKLAKTIHTMETNIEVILNWLCTMYIYCITHSSMPIKKKKKNSLGLSKKIILGLFYFYFLKSTIDKYENQQ